MVGVDLKEEPITIDSVRWADLVMAKSSLCCQGLSIQEGDLGVVLKVDVEENPPFVWISWRNHLLVPFLVFFDRNTSGWSFGIVKVFRGE